EKIQEYLDITCTDNPDEIQERIRCIMPYISRTGNMLADAKKLLRKKKASEISNTIIAIAKEQCLSAKVQNTMIDSIAEEEAYLVDRLDRLNAACTHQVDALRSLLSYTKEELRLTKSGY
ncbi:MAG: hypothetical protein ACK5M3_05350, partial [Dysgonomonas sp.]